MKNIYVVTGGPGFGKTSLIDELRKKGFNGGKELSRGFIHGQMVNGGKFLPWVNRLGYSEIMLRKRIKQYGRTPRDQIWLFDRGIPDLIAYIIKDGFEVPSFYYEAAEEYRYNDVVFFTPPWKEIYKNDSERKESFEEAERIHNEIKRVYQLLDYDCVDIPKEPIEKRTEFVLNKINSIN